MEIKLSEAYLALGVGEVTIENDFLLKKICVLDSKLNGITKNPHDLSNCVVVYQGNIQLPLLSKYSFTDCLFITNSNEYFKDYEDLIVCNHPYITLQNLMQKTGLSEPYGIDEMGLKYYVGKYQRLMIDKDTTLTIGDRCSIGVTGDIIEYVDGVPYQIVSIGAVKIGKNVIIGNNVIIYRGYTGFTEIEDNVVIGDNVIIHHDAHIRKGSIIRSFEEL